MLTLLLFFIAVGGVVLSAYAAAHQPIHAEAALPGAALGLTWRRAREVSTRNGPRVFWLGDGDPTAFSRAYRVAREELRTVGFSWGTAQPNNGMLQPVCWEDPTLPAVVLTTALADAEEALAAEDVRLADEAAAAKRDADRLAGFYATDSRAHIEALRTHLTKLDWAWSKGKRELAAAVLAEPMQYDDVPTIRAGETARRLVREVDAAIARVRERIAKDPSKDWLALAQDPDVREAVHEATRILSGRDDDMATVRNDSGWGKSHSHAGHVLAAEETLSVIMASQALSAVHRHRRQLPHDLRLAIFGAAHF